MPFITVLHVPVSVAIATLHVPSRHYVQYRDSDTQKVLPWMCVVAAWKHQILWGTCTWELWHLTIAKR